MAYVGQTMSLQQEWQFFQRINPRIGNLFAPLDAAIRENFNREEVIDSLHKSSTLGVNQAGIEIPYTNQTATANFKTSEYCCEVLPAYMFNMEVMDLRAQYTQLRYRFEAVQDSKMDR